MLDDLALRAELEPPLIADDAGTLIHVIWRGGQLVDLTGTRWTQVGTVTQVAAANGLPAGASKFDGANHYETASNVDPVDAVTSFAACAIVTPTAADLAATTMVVTGGLGAPGEGWQLVANEIGNLRWYSSNGIFEAPLIANRPNVICFGQDSGIGKMYLKSNMRPILTSTGVMVPLLGQPIKIGCHWDNFLGFQGTIHELWFSSVLPGGASGASWYGPELWDEYFAEITRKAFARLSIPVTAFSSIVFQPAGLPTCNVHLASDGQLLELVATAGSTFSIAAPTGTIRAGQRFTLRVKNASGGALTFGGFPAVCRLAAWTSPANGFSRSITFQFDGANWIEVGRTPADVPN